MHVQPLPAVVAGALMLSAAAFAQSTTPIQTPPPTRAETLPAAPPAQRTPEPIVIYSKEYIGSREPGPQDPQAAREEAAAALAVARGECRREFDRDTRSQCLAQAQDRFRAAMQALR